jgi:integrase
MAQRERARTHDGDARVACRAPNGTGELRWRASTQRYELRIQQGGVRRTIGYFSVARYGSKTAAYAAGERRRREVSGQAAVGSLVVPTRKTVNDALDELLRRSAAYRDVTADGYEDRAAHIRRHLGHLRLEQLTGSQVADFYVALSTQPQPPRQRPLAPKTIRHISGVLVAALDLAVARRDLSAGNPIRLERIKPPRLRKRRYELFAAGEIEALLDATRETAPWLHVVILLLSWCGLRPGEALALQAGDFEGNTLTVQRSVSDLATTKSDAGYRTITVDRAVLDAVGRLPAPPSATPWLLPGERGGPRTLKQLDAAFESLLRRLRLRHRRPYDLRHTAISHAIAYARETDGVSIEDVAVWAGHSRSSTTLDNYTHLLPNTPGVVATMARAYRGTHIGSPQAFDLTAG